MNDDTFRTELKEAGTHLKAAMRATLVAVRGVMDAAIDALGNENDGSTAPSGGPGATAGAEPEGTVTSAEAGPAPPASDTAG